MEWPPPVYIIFSQWLLGAITNEEFCELMKERAKYEKEKKEKAAQS